MWNLLSIGFVVFISQVVYSTCGEVNPVPFIHRTCRNGVYPKSNMIRFGVPDHLVSWNVSHLLYFPMRYESPKLATIPFVDPAIDDASFKPKWNSVDGDIDRTSFHGDYKIQGKYPLNVAGRTGLTGRGLMKRWGVNHAADAIVTRWKRNSDGSIVKDAVSGKQVLQMVAIQRLDNLMWALPGGKVDPGEHAFDAVKREFFEEAMNSKKIPEVDQLFDQNATKIYTGYVDDPRNTDNAWFETSAYNFHDESGQLLKNVNFEAGSDAGNVEWLDLDQSLNLYASHKFIIAKMANLLNCHW